MFPESVSPVHGNCVGIGVEEGNVLGSKSVLLFIVWSVEGPGVHGHAVHLMWRCAWLIVVWGDSEVKWEEAMLYTEVVWREVE